ncbi:hypothetical protein Tco_0386422 [Tanacetum coccineum]
MCTYLKNIEGYKLNDLKFKEFDSIQEMFYRAFKRVNTFEDFRTELVEGKEKRAGIELEQELTKKHKMDDDKETSELKQCLEIIPDEEEVTIDAIPLAVKSLSIVGWKIHKEGRKSYYQIMRADEKSEMYMIFSHTLKSFDREDLENLYKLVKAKYKSTRPVEDIDLVLWNDLKTMFEPHVEDEGRIDAIDADEEITLVSVHDVNVSAGEEEVVEVINTAKLIIDAAQVSVAGDKDKGKGILIEPVKSMKKKDQIRLDEETALKRGGGIAL